MTARKLRKDMSLPEVLLWQRLRGAQAGAKFRRQHPIGPYVVDFYCGAARLVVEVDGATHDHRQTADRFRDAFLRENGFEIMRVSAAEVLSDADRVADSIGAAAANPLHRPADGPPPRAGEDAR
ncbi:endonuclease domain-containing protein [Sphingomonas sp.]|uniref:endonuclease domain-containing protein n=1 Tax=Sphingomonas sp. TaxID=28214 RepID=UPI003B3B97D3